MAPKYASKFQLHWLNEGTLYHEWVRQSNCDTEALCRFCKKSIDLSAMGEAALRSHAKSVKHISLVAGKSKTPNIGSFLQHPVPKQSNPVVGSSATVEKTPLEQSTTQLSSSDHSSSMRKFLVKDSTTKAEILWCLQVVANHTSLRTGASGANVFARMFPDSEIAKSMQLGKDKIKYNITYGLSVYFADELERLVSKSQFYSVSFDESLNKITQCGQMDIHVRFWKDNRVISRYLTSVFLRRARAEDLLDAFKQGTEKLTDSKIIHVSMDGPNVNHKFLRLLNAERQDDLPRLLDCGTCSLHVVNGSIKSADEMAGSWNVGKFLTAIYFVFKDSPMRRALFLQMNGVQASNFPMKFCAVRWVENKKVAERAIELLPKLQSFVQGVSGTRDEPSCQSYFTMKKFMSDKLLPAKLAFFSKISSELEVFLVRYQTDSPLMPFIYEDLSTIVVTLLGRVIRKDILEAKSLKQLTSLDLDNPGVRLPAENLDLGFAVKEEIKKVREELKKNDILQFRKEAGAFVKKIAQKINEKSPLKHILVKGFSSFSPSIMLNQGRCESRINTLLNELVHTGNLLGRTADVIKHDYLMFVADASVMTENKEYQRQIRLDDHFQRLYQVATFQVSQDFKTLVQKVLCITHGQAAVERGFNINKEILICNLQGKSLIAQRVVHDAICATGKSYEELEITPSMMQAVKNSSRLYREDLDRKKKEDKTCSEQETKKRRIEQLVKEKEEEMKRMKHELESTIVSYQNEIVKLRDEL